MFTAASSLSGQRANSVAGLPPWSWRDVLTATGPSPTACAALTRELGMSATPRARSRGERPELQTLSHGSGHGTCHANTRVRKCARARVHADVCTLPRPLRALYNRSDWSGKVPGLLSCMPCRVSLHSTSTPRLENVTRLCYKGNHGQG